MSTQYLSSDQLFIEKIEETIRNNLDNTSFSVTNLGEITGYSRSQLHRKLKNLTGKSASRFILDIRLCEAMKMLEARSGTVSEVAFSTGFTSPAYFSKCFRTAYGVTPGAVRDGKRIEKRDAGLARKRKHINRSTILLFVIIFTFTTALLISLIYAEKLQSSLGSGETAYTKSLIVLPFSNHSDDQENEHFADGIMEDLFLIISRIEELRVVSSTTSQSLKEKTYTARELYRSHNIDFIVEGSVRKAGETVKIAIQLIDARVDAHIWGEEYFIDLGNIENMFTAQEDVARNVYEILIAKLGPGEGSKFAVIPTHDKEAYELFLLGRYNWDNLLTDRFEKSIGYFRSAVEKDPQYAHAWAALANIYYTMMWSEEISVREGASIAREMALKAIGLNKNIGEAQAVLAGVEAFCDWKWRKAGRRFRKAVRLSPNSAAVRLQYAEYLDIIRDNGEARKNIDVAIKLEPWNFYLRSFSAQLHYHNYNWIAAREELLELGKMDSGYLAYSTIMHPISHRLNNDSLTIQVLKDIFAQIDPVYLKYSLEIDSVYNEGGTRAILYWLIEIFHKSPLPNNYTVARFYSMLGEGDSSIFYINKAIDEHKPIRIPRINNDPDFDNLRESREFRKALMRMGIPGVNKK